MSIQPISKDYDNFQTHIDQELTDMGDDFVIHCF